MTDVCKGFQPNSLLAIRFVLAVCLELVLFYVFIVYFWGFLRVDHVVLCSVQGIGNTAGLEGLDNHTFNKLATLLGYVFRCTVNGLGLRQDVWLIQTT